MSKKKHWTTKRGKEIINSLKSIPNISTLTADEVAELTGYKTSSIYYYARKANIPLRKAYGKTTDIPLADVDIKKCERKIRWAYRRFVWSPKTSGKRGMAYMADQLTYAMFALVTRVMQAQGEEARKVPDIEYMPIHRDLSIIILAYGLNMIKHNTGNIAMLSQLLHTFLHDKNQRYNQLTVMGDVIHLKIQGIVLVATVDDKDLYKRLVYWVLLYYAKTYDQLDTVNHILVPPYGLGGE